MSHGHHPKTRWWALLVGPAVGCLPGAAIMLTGYEPLFAYILAIWFLMLLAVHGAQVYVLRRWKLGRRGTIGVGLASTVAMTLGLSPTFGSQGAPFPPDEQFVVSIIAFVLCGAINAAMLAIWRRFGERR